MNKDKFRKEIDNLDSQILDLLEKRIDAARQIGKIKLEAVNRDEM